MLAPVRGAGLFERLAAIHPELTAFRRDLHAHPELGFAEHRTAARVAEALRVAGVDEVHTGVGRTGLVAVIRGRSTASGRGVGLRADMDALPIREENGFAWRSTQSAVMHACGHDGHTTMLVGAARALAESRAFDGTAVLIFQPGEEGCGGAQAMLDDGLFERFPVDAIYAMHNWPSLPAGSVGINRGAMMAAADRVEITIEGRGGHGAHPYLAVDPVLAAAHLITAAQSLVSRNVNPLDHAVVSLCTMQAGEPGAFNIIPRTVKLSGTVRSFRREVQDMIEERLTALSHNVAQAFGAAATVDYQRSFPATVNSPAHADLAADAAAALVGDDHVVRDLPPSMGAEDFASMLQARPGAYLRLGQAGAGDRCFLHSSRYDFNDEVLPLGAALLATIAQRALPLAA